MERIIEKKTIVLIAMALSLMLILCGACSFAYAAESEVIKKDGVTYTLTYPDGKVVTENDEGKPLTYDDVIEAQKEENWRLLGSGYTSDENGRVLLPSAWSKGTIKILETKIPLGYIQGDESEKIVNLEDGNTEFVNPKEQTTPGTKYYKITYKLNGGSYEGSTKDIVETYEYGTVIDIHEAPIRDGYSFDYWKGSEYQPGDKYKVTEDHTFVAQWDKSDDPSSITPTPTKTTPPTSTTTIKRDASITGDMTNPMMWIILLIVSCLFLLICVRRYREESLSADGSAGLSSINKMLLVLIVVVAGAFMATTIYANNGFTINKIDDNGNPVEGAVFDVYGKPVVTFEEIPEPDKTEIKVTKNWDDADDQDGKRPHYVTVNLMADGIKKDEITLNKENNWAHTFTDLEEKKDGKAIDYTVEEVNVPAGYTHEITGSADMGYTITNTHEPEKVTVEGTKIWDDENNNDGKRPGLVTIRLHADGAELPGQTAMATEFGDWKYEFKDLPKYKNGKEIVYTVTEDVVREYTASYSTVKDNYDIRNSYTPGKTSVIVEKAWKDNNNQDGARPASVVVKLLANGVEKDRATITAAENWRHVFTNLDIMQSGEEIEYTVEEEKTSIITGTDGPGTYSTEVSGNEERGYTITNTHTPETINIESAKNWDDANNQDGKRPKEITIRLHADGTEVDSAKVTATENWKCSFANKPKYANGREIEYTVTEDSVADYTTVYSTIVGNYDITNKYTPGKRSVTVEKVWEDAENQDGIRPSSVTVKLFADGVDTGKTLTLNETNQWEADFTDLDVKKAGQDIVYTVEEEKTDIITGNDSAKTYAIAITGNANTGYIITNTHTPQTTTIRGLKIWDDKDNQDGKRPTEVTFRLHANGKVIRSAKVNAENHWRVEFNDLPVNSNGNKINYRVTEDSVDGYTSTGGDVRDNYTITNNYTPGKTSVTVTKSWDDTNNQDNIRPSSVTVKLLADGVPTGKTATLNEENQWEASFADLDAMKAGQKIVYTVEEVKTNVINGTDGSGTYAVTVTGDASTGYTITNTHTPDKYVLIYDPNGGVIDNSKKREEVESQANSHSFTIKDNTYLGLSHSNENRVFMGWADTADATVPKYSADGKGIKDGGDGKPVDINDLAKTIKLNAPDKEKTIYAVWGTQYSLSFDPNHGYLGGNWKGGTIPDDLKTMTAFSTKESHLFRIPVQTADNTPVRENEQKWNWKWWGLRYNATGPATEKNPHWLYDQPITLYADGDVANGKPEAKQTLYAFYQPSNGAQVIFDKNTTDNVTNMPSNFGTSETNENVDFYIGSQVPKRTNYQFIGWSTEKDRKAKDFDPTSKTDFNPGDQFAFNQILEAYHTLYAVWKPLNQYRIHFVYNEEVSRMYEDGVYRIVNGGFLHHYFGVSSYGEYEVDGVKKTSEYMIKSDYTLDNEHTWTKQYWSGVGVHGRHVTTDTTEYEFLGWSTNPDDDAPEYTVDSEGYINMDIKQEADEDSSTGIHDLVLYGVWKKTPKHTFRLLFMCTDSYNRYDTIVNRATGKAESFSLESPLYSYKKKADGSRIVVMPGTSQYANVGFIKKAAPLSDTEYRVSKEDLNTKGPKATKANTSTYDVELIGWSYEPWKRSNPDIPVDKDGYFLDDIVLEEPKVSPDECGGEVHNLLLWPVWKFTPKHTYNVYFSVNTGVEVANRIHFYNTTADEWQVSDKMYTHYRHNAETDEWTTTSNIGFWVRTLNSVAGGGYSNSKHTGDKYIHYYSDETSASVHTPPWNESFWKSQRIYAERDDTETVRYKFAGWRRSDTGEVIPVDENGYLTKAITFDEDDDVLGLCESKEEGTSHNVILFPVWEKIPLNTWTILFATNIGGYNVGLDENGNKKTTSSNYRYPSDAYSIPVVNSANDTVSHITTVNHGWAPSSRYTSGPYEVDSEFGRRYVWTKEFWQSHGETAVMPNTRTARYEFLGWSYGEKSTGSNGSPIVGGRYPGALTEDDVDIHVDENGLINEDIEIKDPIGSTTQGYHFHRILYGVWKTIPVHSYHLHFNKNFTYDSSTFEVGVHFQAEENGSWLFAPQMNTRTTADYSTEQFDVEGNDHYTWEADGFWDTHGCYATRPDRMRDSEYYTYEFLGWSDAKDDEGNALDPSKLTEEDVDYHMAADGKHIAEDITITDDDNCEGGEHHLTLYAVWKPVPRTRSYTINYDVNGGTGTFNSETKTELYNHVAWAETSPDFDIPTAIPTKDNFAFVGWAQNKDATFGEFGYQHGNDAELRNITRNLKPTINYTFDDHKTGDLTASKTLYAVWWYEYDISFNVNAQDASGGPAVQHIYRNSDHAIVKAFGEDDNDPLPSPVRPGYRFLGWSRDATATVPEFSTVSGYPSQVTIEGDPRGRKAVTFFAVWEKI